MRLLVSPLGFVLTASSAGKNCSKKSWATSQSEVFPMRQLGKMKSSTALVLKGEGEYTLATMCELPRCVVVVVVDRPDGQHHHS